jgi:predicted Zn-dependent peptidase
MPFHQHTLSNGLQIIGETNPAALCTAVAFWVQTGARDETTEVSGVSHFLEHMVFKGTERRDAAVVNRDFARIGANNNAFTSEENTVFHAAVLPEYLPEVVDVLADIMRPSLRLDDFTTEKKVILDEIVRYEVQPGSAAIEAARKTYYGDHPLGNSVLGSTESITALTRDQMAEYFNRRYVTPNIFVAAAGNFDFPRFVELVEKACSKWPSGQRERLQRREVKGAGGIHVIKRPVEKVSQQYAFLISPSPPADSPMRYAAGLLTTVIGDSTGSRMFWALTDTGLAEDAGMGADECDHAGAYYTSFNCAPENAEECYGIVDEIFADVQKKGISRDELNQARTKIMSREVLSVERTHRRLMAICKDWAYLHQYRTLDDELAAWDAVTLDSVRELLDRYPLTNYTTLTLGPLDSFAGKKSA